MTSATATVPPTSASPVPAGGDPMREKRVEMVLQQLDELPTLPMVTVRVLEATGSDDSDAREVIELISSDPALTTRILQMVRSAAVGVRGGVRGEVATVERAVMMLGFEAVRSAALAVAIFDTFGDPNVEAAPAEATAAGGAIKFSRAECWKHAVAVGCAAELLANALREQWGRDAGVDANEAFVCGLLHDLGKIAMDAVLPKSFGKVVEAADLLRGNIADVERSVIGLDHMVVGKRLCERWQLPATIRECAWLHGQLPSALPATVRNPRMVNLITLADVLTRQQHIGYSGNYAFPVPRQQLLDAVGISDAAAVAVQAKIVERTEPRAAALGLDRSSSGELYSQALARANRELGRLGNQLALRNRKLAVRAKLFDALSQFHGELRPDAPTQEVLRAVGQTATAVVGGGGAIVVFSLPPGQAYAEFLAVGEAGEVLDTALADCAVRPVRPTGAALIGPAGAELEWLMGQAAPRLAGERRWWVPLEAEGVCVGGVVWGGGGDEPARLEPQAKEIAAVAGGWSLALRTSQIREEARALSEQLAESNRSLQDAQGQIARSKALVTVGEMAAGAAHEMNNPLAVISGRAQILAAQLTDAKQAQAAGLIVEQSHRLSEMITELMAFARPAPARAVVTAASELVGLAVRQVQARPEHVDRKIEVTPGDVPAVRADVAQAAGALAEILDNALQATEGPPAGAVGVTVGFDPYSGSVVVTVADDGPGMDERTLKRAFDPFFSAKAAGRRRGMGLAKALRWVEANGGSVRLDSRPGQGTRALVLLPAAGGGGGDGGVAGQAGEPATVSDGLDARK